MDLSTPLQFVKGIGPARAQMLEGKGLFTAEDLLGYAPFRYEDRTNVKSISQLAPGEMATVIAEVTSAKSTKLRGRMALFEARFSDASRSVLLGKWFHGDYLKTILVPGLRVALFGKIEFDSFSGALSVMHPEFEILSSDDDTEAALHLGRIVPIHEAVGKITPRVMRTLIYRVCESLGGLADPLPAVLRERFAFPDYATALRHLHFPPSGEDVRVLNAFRSRAQQRLIFEEFFWLQCGVQLRRSKTRLEPGIAFDLNDRVREQIKRMLPFKPTAAQKRVLKEIAEDMAAPRPMNRLLQGDVGSGKTLVAAESAIIAVENHYQVALIAPTEILATQHYLYLKNLFSKLGYVVALVTGSLPARDKQKLKQLMAAGLIHVTVGTHALLEEDVSFHRLGLAIIDEQHRFGVMQRLRLMEKGVTPDVLVMTATPIPRTLSMTLYGDLDVSVIDELPPGRKPIRTSHVSEDRIEQVWSFLKGEIARGYQAYVVYPLIEESETASMKAAEKMYRHLQDVVFPDLRIGLLHGRMASDDKESVMQAFKGGDLHVLVSTTVIEVGVDVPNASVMIIEQAERFGLSQLHQLRGRVGRGAAQSHCILVTGKMNETSRERIRTMVDSSDGFYIAEMDFKLRGPGEFFGTKQSGMPLLRIANMLRDQELLMEARREAFGFLEQPPSEGERDRVMEYLRGPWLQRYGLARVG
ncbi:MAG: ATP-dependent DNA helicase RecG [Bryobacteraceae bacterium]